MRTVFFLIILFFFLTILETSFLVHFRIFDFIPNLILIAIILINLFEKTENLRGVFSAILGGFFLEVFSSNFWGYNFFGFYILLFLLISIFIKLIFKRYFRLPNLIYD
jgi:rod shape-determining protein MreD